MGRGLAVTTTRVGCGSRAFGTPPTTPALLTAARGAPLSLVGFDLGFGPVIVMIASTTWSVRVVAGRLSLRRALRVRLRRVRRLVRLLPVRLLLPVRGLRLVRVGLIRA
ncbi:hypothetical protein [Streptomyces sp. NPDC058335]|uniref:hypothetical protein n=1 Tax=Streptomyces sp. NPDC058335 TaxID=3346451 RepID=UPI003649FFA3